METTEGVHAYLTSPGTNGNNAMCFIDEERKVGLQAQHRVKKLGRNDEPSAVLIVDFALETMEEVTTALAVMQEPFDMDIDIESILQK